MLCSPHDDAAMAARAEVDAGSDQPMVVVRPEVPAAPLVIGTHAAPLCAASAALVDGDSKSSCVTAPSVTSLIFFSLRNDGAPLPVFHRWTLTPLTPTSAPKASNVRFLRSRNSDSRMPHSYFTCNYPSSRNDRRSYL